LKRLKTAFRNLLHNKTSTVINILGLALGLAAFISIGAYVRWQRSYDRMLAPAGSTVYRVESSFYRGSQITDLLTWDLISLILPAALVALPLSTMAIRQWMQGFAFRAPFSWGLLLAPVPMLIIIIIFSTGWLTLRAARVNPVNSLKEE
jgi:hypothetical protein